MQKEQVRRFYELIWNEHDKEVMPSILHEDFTFRGSLGQEKRGHAGFGEYVDMIHRALADYCCIIDDLVEEGQTVCARMTFTGIHRDDFMGYAPTGKQVSWIGCAIFSFDGERIADVWVLGDLKGLENQLREQEGR